MMAINAANERIKRRYGHFLQEAEGLQPATINHALAAIYDFETFTSGLDFKKFKPDLAIAYKREVLARSGRRKGDLASRSTVASKLNRVQRFFRWLSCQEGYRTHLKHADVEFFNLSERNKRLAKAPSAKPAPTLTQIRHVILSMPSETDVQRRDRALIACALLTGCRVAALCSLKIKHVRADRLGIDQDAHEVNTKFSKSQTTLFFPVGDDIRDIFLGYVDHLLVDLKWGSDDPLFPATRQSVENGELKVTGVQRIHWQTADPVRSVFRRAFASARIPYFTPHTIRNCLALLGEQVCRSPEEFKAWSQNLGHDQVLTTYTSYGAVPLHRQVELFNHLGAQKNPKWVQFQALMNDPEIQAGLAAAAIGKLENCK